MTLSSKRLQKLALIDRLIELDIARKKTRFRPDRVIFLKINKLVETWARNLDGRDTLDSEEELHQIFHKLTTIAGTFDLTILFAITTKHNLEQCQLVLMKGAIENKIMRPTIMSSYQILPVVKSYAMLTL